jgi:hypothetical protein
MVQEWWDAIDSKTPLSQALKALATSFAQWGAAQELEACCEWLRSKDILEPAIDALRAARRPKPPSLKEQALEARRNVWRSPGDSASWEILDLAIEALPDE